LLDGAQADKMQGVASQTDHAMRRGIPFGEQMYQCTLSRSALTGDHRYLSGREMAGEVFKYGQTAKVAEANAFKADFTDPLRLQSCIPMGFSGRNPLNVLQVITRHTGIVPGLAEVHK